MFTGIIEEIGTVSALHSRGGGREFSIACQTVLEGLKTGDSVCVDGACLTVEKVLDAAFTVFASPETMTRTTLKDGRAGIKVNLERALRLSDRLNGHLVQGHVDATGVIVRQVRKGESLVLTVLIDGDLGRTIAEKGSVALCGVSLTVAQKRDKEISVSLIPETLRRTTLGEKGPGDKVNIETDILAKYIESLAGPLQGGLTLEKLKGMGF
jgi:riboflavin synthase